MPLKDSSQKCALTMATHAPVRVPVADPVPHQRAPIAAGEWGGRVVGDPRGAGLHHQRPRSRFPRLSHRHRGALDRRAWFGSICREFAPADSAVCIFTTTAKADCSLGPLFSRPATSLTVFGAVEGNHSLQASGSTSSKVTPVAPASRVTPQSALFGSLRRLRR
jgi:hypothetical protein